MKAVITGASRGIGLELCSMFLENDHEVVALARNPNSSGGLNALRKEFVDRIKILKCDVTNREEIHSVTEALSGQAIDVLVNNAGVFGSTDESLQELSYEDLEMCLQTNCVGPLMMTKAMLPNLKKAQNSKIANISSRMGSVADNSSGGYYAYRMSKSAVNMFSKGLSIDFPEIICLNIHPGWVRTEMGGRNATVATRESARGIYQLIVGATLEQSGKFLNYKGEELPW